MPWQPGSVEATEGEIRARPPRPWGRRFGWLSVIVAVAAFVATVDGVREHASTSSIVAPAMQVLLWTSFAVQALAPGETVVDATGIRRPGRRTVPWSQIERVRRPGRYDDGIGVEKRDGRVIRVHVPLVHAADVARIGRVPLEDQ